jgi:hypothetical protein
MGVVIEIFVKYPMEVTEIGGSEFSARCAVGHFFYFPMTPKCAPISNS